MSAPSKHEEDFEGEENFYSRNPIIEDIIVGHERTISKLKRILKLAMTYGLDGENYEEARKLLRGD